jgi:tetratricopeptide (TPR) repeat protein
LELADNDELRRRIRLERALARVILNDYQTAAEELSALVPELTGDQKLDALSWLGLSYVWTERETETIATAEQAFALAKELGDDSGIAAALALESEGLAMRGEEGDLDRALELGDRALERWVPGKRDLELTHILHLHANTTAWRGHYERTVELSRQTSAIASDVHSAEALLRGGGLEALALAGLGRHEEAIALWDRLFGIARELDQNHRGLLNYSSLAYRELYDLEEARARSGEALELSAGMQFGMPKQFAGSDLIQTHLLAGDVGAARTDWSTRWEEAGQASGWTTWLIAGRLLAARAEIALEAETPNLPPSGHSAPWRSRAEHADGSMRPARSRCSARPSSGSVDATRDCRHSAP